MADLFGINDYQWGRRTQKARYDAKYGRTADLEHLTAARQNPEQYTMHQPHGGAKPAFTFDDWSSGGIDDNDWDEVIPIYKIPQPEPAPAPAPAPPEPEPYRYTPSSSTPTNNYQSQIAALTASIAQQQQQAAAAQETARLASEQATAARTADAQASAQKYQSQLAASEQNYQSQLAALQQGFNTRYTKQQQGFDTSLASGLAKQQQEFDSRYSQQQQGFDTSLAQQAEAQAAYLNDLQIQQDTRLGKMALDAKTRSDALALGQRTYQQNQGRSNQLSNLQIGGNEAPRTGGTQAFKRRKLQVNPVTANALSGILGGSSATSSTNTLNV